MTALDIGVLGELTVSRAGQPITVTGPGRRALLALLAANAGHVLTVDQMIDALWGADPPTSAVKVVQTHVSQLRRLLEPGRDRDWQILVTRPSGYHLDVEAGAIDARRFEAAVTATSTLPTADTVEPLREALALWRGRPYAGIDRPFVDAEVARLDQLRLAALTRCLAGEVTRGRHREVEPELRALLAEHPLDESVAELLMLALYRSGLQGDALNVHARLRRDLAEELGTDPGPSVARLHERILRHDPGLAQARGNLPPPRSSFIGRDVAVAEVVGMVREHRLTTLVGAGGAGKTRLALRVAADAAAGFDGAWLVALGTLDDPAHLAGHCLAELGLVDQMDRHPLDTLRGWIGDHERLLVMDNCEHLVDDVAMLVDQLLASCPRLHVLATSRLPLRCSGEHQWRVPTLTVPSEPDVTDVRASEAGALFAARAADARPGFLLDDATAPAVHRICRRLDGIPLAIELAAVRMASMTAADLADGLDDRFHLLTSGNRTALPRHRTLLATTDWSYDLLSTDQQVLLCRLSIFAADFDADAAAEVCGCAPLDTRSVPGLLADLVDHSLVESYEKGGHTRYRLLETVREYGRARLGGEVEDVTRRYGAWVAGLTEAVGANAQVDTATWYGLLDQEFLHVQGAFAAAVRLQDAETALRIAAGSGWALVIIGRFHRLREWLQQALALARDTDVDDRTMAQGLMMAGAVAGIDHRFEGTLDLLSEAHERFTRVGSIAGTLWTGYWRAATLGEMGDLDAALSVIEDTVDAAARHGLEVIEANALSEQTELIVAAGLARSDLARDRPIRADRAAAKPDPEVLAAARTSLTRARRLADDNGMQELSARVAFSDVALTALEGDPELALALAHQRLDAWREFGRGNRLILALVATARIALLADRPDDARPLLDEGFRLIAECAWPGPVRGAAEVLADLSATAHPEAAATLLGVAEARAPTHRWRMPCDADQTRERLLQVLGAETFAACRDEGARLGLDQVLALASAVLPVQAVSRSSTTTLAQTPTRST